jgi:hypothetical protein
LYSSLPHSLPVGRFPLVCFSSYLSKYEFPPPPFSYFQVCKGNSNCTETW